MNQSLIFDIKRYAINDGPGVRVTVFFKGCPLSCAWCHNPESHERGKQKLYTQEKCIGCGDCVEACEQNASMLTADGILTDTETCILCGKCAHVCPTKATELSGEPLDVEEIMKVILRDRPLMEQSSGGVTFSGGEPLLHSEMLLDLLERCGEKGIHRCVDTSGFAQEQVLLETAQHCDLFLFDLKVINAGKHKEITGISNELILNNLTRLAETGADIIIRIPLVKGVNDDERNIRKTAEFIQGLPGPQKPINLLPFHNVAATKYAKLGLTHKINSFTPPLEERQLQIIEEFSNFGLNASFGG